jgi:SAM-dependent methyltransferase
MEDHSWFAALRSRVEAAYLAHEEPWRGSGFSGPEARWVALRRPVADCIDRSGSFLDVGCANGYLLECVGRWTGTRGLAVDLYGVDMSEPLVSLARARMPGLADHFWVANAFTWTPPRTFDFVRTELVYVPAEREAEYLRHLLEHYVSDGGAVLVANYLEEHPDPQAHILAGAAPTTRLCDRLAVLGFTVAGVHDGFDDLKGRRTRIAIVRG